MTMGIVKFYSEAKGYSFIALQQCGKDVFVHATALERAGMRGLSEGQTVSFGPEADGRSGNNAVSNMQRG